MPALDKCYGCGIELRPMDRTVHWKQVGINLPSPITSEAAFCLTCHDYVQQAVNRTVVSLKPREANP